MIHRRGTSLTSVLRRHALQFGLGTAMGLTLGGAFGSSLALSPPSALPVAGATYAHPEMLVDAAWVAEHHDDPMVVLVGFMPAEGFADGYIPRSVQLGWPALEVIDTSDASIARWRDQTIEILASLGITRNHTVVAYDAGMLFAARLWWVLHYLGHDDTHVLNGGLAVWQQVRGEIATDATPAAHTASSTSGEFQSTPWPGTCWPNSRQSGPVSMIPTW